MEIRIGNGYDVHLLAPGLPLVLGGVKIEHTKGCIAHSDGDVIIHALCDALLGALALGDIGQHFPDTSDEFKGIDSKILLERTYKMITERGYHLVNADVTLLLQKPKIAPYVVKMRKTLANVLDVAPDRVSIKATTTEGAGYIGREEGTAAYAVVIISRTS
ncbi:MAG: 2-C-methyl-D-erythritol 2,4-cyclodiphosphate synthase [Bacteroidales bacterium]|jgi:2-C-methyl-D-erythritol 2,4-cyclodiphosphate synthase|nr:2-C-methyl-D-erythritol 2,4-cyclodiphosphate synthase [Bacteroidales bacterium]MCI1733038.1 2-C-methyl-D-erythritol 2,4-cyclodiphosphate synthase [Bacteroidales bacterium]